MKRSCLVSVCGAIGLMTVSPVFASSVTTEFGRPLLVEGVAAGANCGDTALNVEADVQGWHDALASKRASDLQVNASWSDALGKTLVQDRSAALSLTESAGDCPLTN